MLWWVAVLRQRGTSALGGTGSRVHEELVEVCPGRRLNTRSGVLKRETYTMIGPSTGTFSPPTTRTSVKKDHTAHPASPRRTL